MRVEQRTKHPEAGPWHKCTQMFTVIIGYPRNFQIRVIKLIRGSKVLKGRSTANQILEIKRIILLCFRTIFLFTMSRIRSVYCSPVVRQFNHGAKTFNHAAQNFLENQGFSHELFWHAIELRDPFFQKGVYLA